MGQQVSRQDFEWVYTEEPHATRRKEILAKHPEVRSLMGHDTTMLWSVLTLVTIQILSLFVLQHCSWTICILVGYCFGGVINHTLSLAIHELAHNLAFGHSRPTANRLLAFVANWPLVFPMAVSFKKYHLLHHRYQGDIEQDMDLPTEFEGKFFHRRWTKLLWVFLQPLFYTLRPVVVLPLPVTQLEFYNIFSQLFFCSCIYWTFGGWALVYFISSLLLAMGVHPVAGHFISEHYMFRKGYETYSYYGILNKITFNVGFHNEHHDFPNIPGSRLPLLKKMAPEYYDNLPCHHSWARVLYDFVMDPAIGPYARIKRRPSKSSKEIVVPDS